MKNYTSANIINIMWQGEKHRERGFNSHCCNNSIEKGVILYMIDFEEILFQFANMHLLQAIPTLNYDNGELLNAFCKYYNSENKYIIAIKVLKVDDYYKVRIRHAGIVEEIKISADYDECMTLALVEQSYMFIIMERLEQLKNEI